MKKINKKSMAVPEVLLVGALVFLIVLIFAKLIILLAVWMLMLILSALLLYLELDNNFKFFATIIFIYIGFKVLVSLVIFIKYIIDCIQEKVSK